MYCTETSHTLLPAGPGLITIHVRVFHIVLKQLTLLSLGPDLLSINVSLYCTETGHSLLSSIITCQSCLLLISKSPNIDIYFLAETDPAVDILAATGYIVSRSEVGDYCVQRLSDGNIDALDGLALPVLLQRSITAPLTAQ